MGSGNRTVGYCVNVMNYKKLIYLERQKQFNGFNLKIEFVWQTFAYEYSKSVCKFVGVCVCLYESGCVCVRLYVAVKFNAAYKQFTCLRFSAYHYNLHKSWKRADSAAL